MPIFMLFKFGASLLYLTQRHDKKTFPEFAHNHRINSEEKF